MVASSATSATARSDGCVATHWSLVPRMACVRFSPPIAGQPDPGARRLHGDETSRKYVQRGRCIRLPPMEAMLRSCADALSSSACEITGNWVRTKGWAARSVIRTSAPTVSPRGPRVIPLYGKALMSTRCGGRSTVSRIRSTIVVPPAMYRPPEASADRSSAAFVKVKGNISHPSPTARWR